MKRLLKKGFLLLISLSVSALSMNAQGDVLYKTDSYTWQPTKMIERSFSGTAESATKIVSTYSSASSKDDNHKYTWTKKNDLTPYPVYSSPFLIEEAVYNLGLDEMINAVESDNTLRTGESWSGVWTRDVSYSIYLAMSYMQKVPTKTSLLKKIDSKGRIIQDTGTGGSWPVSTDRMVWALAAWEYYLVHGELDWITQVYPYIKKSVDSDRLSVYDAKTGLMMGESSFIDWREQSYPRWMQPADIARSKCLGTNAVHYESLVVLSKMATVLGKEAESAQYTGLAADLKAAINEHLWMEEEGYYAQYLYGRNNDIVSTRSETLGEALCILLDIASPEQQARMMANMPVTDYGPNIFFPNIPNQFSYHNNAVWPFVTSYWMLAAAKLGNEEAVKHTIGSTYRAAVMFATNKENFTAETGDWTGTHTNSNNMLWSLSGNIATIHRVYFGMYYEEDKMVFKPFVPESLAGSRTLDKVTYRGATLNIEISGYGDQIKSFLLDGAPSAAEISSTLTGEHTVKIELTNTFKNSTHPINIMGYKSSLQEPIASFRGNKLSWGAIDGATGYAILKDGVEIARQAETTYDITLSGEYQVIAVCEDKMLSSLASEPIMRFPTEVIIETGSLTFGKNEIKNAAGQIVSGSTYTTTINIDKEGLYSFDWLYSNGQEGILNDNRCANRTLFIDNTKLGLSIFPQRGKNEWAARGWSNPLQMHLTAGSHKIELKFLDENANMNWDVNDVTIHQFRATLLKEETLPAEKEYNLIGVSRADGVGKRIANIHSSSGFNNNTENIYKLLIGSESVYSNDDKWYADNTESPWVIFSLSDIYAIDKIEWRDCNWYEVKHDVINSGEYWIYVSTTGTKTADWVEVAHETNVIHQNIKTAVFDTPAEARYIKFALKPGGSDKKKIRIYGFDIYGEFSRKVDRDNMVSVGKTIVGSCSYTSDRETAANLLDGISNNYWGIDNTVSDPSWVIVDLEGETEISKFVIVDSSTWITGCNISVSNEELAFNDAKWTPVVTNAELKRTTVRKEIELDEKVKARYVKLEIPKSSQGATTKIKEFEIYGPAGETAIDDVESESQSIRIYPNPATDFFHIDTPADGRVMIYNISGRLVLTHSASEGSSRININDLDKGLYLVKIISGDKVESKRLMKK